MTDQREARLPKWAQEELTSLRRQLKTARTRIDELRWAVGETNTSVLNYGNDDQPLANNAHVQFDFPGKRWDNHIQVYIEGGRLRIQGGRTLVIYPSVSNAFWVELEDR